jgi:Domain of unknown function (DUF4136)
MAGLMLLLVTLVGLAACTTITPHIASDYDRSAEFSTLHNFTLTVRPHASLQSALVEQETYDAIKEELTSKGFTYVLDPAQADFAVDFSVGAKDRLGAKSYPIHYTGPWGLGAWGNEVDVRQFRQGTLAIDVFDVRSGRAIWHGAAEKELSQSEMAHSDAPIRESVTAVLVTFPPT